MRYIPISHLREGMELARPLYGSNFSVLLGKGVRLSGQHVRRINDMGYAGVYIAETGFKEIMPVDVVPDALRLRTIKSAKDIMRQAESRDSRASARITRARQEGIVLPVIEDITGNKARMVDLIDLKPYDDYIYYHAANVMVLSLLLGVEMNLAGHQLYELGISALLHDMGNIFIPKDILNKPGRLNDEEYGIVKQHSKMGFDFLRKHFSISIEGCMGALQHHENYNGTGYPSQLKGERISLFGRIIALTDVYDALTSRRSYRRFMYPAPAIDYICMNAGTLFDPEVVRAFQRVVMPYPSGVCVELSNNLRCIVVENRADMPDRPKVRILDRPDVEPKYIDLRDDTAYAAVFITQVLELD